MTVETLTCGRCGDRVPLDTDHGEVVVEMRRTDDRDDRDDYALCLDCVIDIGDEWASPV